MKTKNENDKSVEQIALEIYAKKVIDKRYEDIGVLVGIIVGSISAISFVFYVLTCDTCLYDYVIIGFVAIIICGITCMFAMACVILFSRMQDKKIVKFVSLLSEEEKKKIVMDYVNKCMEDIQKTKKAYEEQIFQLHQSIYRCNNELGNLEEEFFPKEYKKKNVWRDKLPSNPRPSDFWCRSAHEDDGACD